MKKATLLVGAAIFGLSAFGQEEVESTPLEQVQERTQALEESVEKLQKLKVSGYIQTQFQWGEGLSTLKVGAKNTNTDESYNRIGIRRGRLKFVYEEGLVGGVFQLDITEKGVSFKDAYLSLKLPALGQSLVQAGVFDRPFGYEIGYSSSRRESPERSLIFQTLFPDERDLGGMLTLQAPATSPWHLLKLKAGLFAGNGIKQETDSRKDFIAQIMAKKTFGNHTEIGLGVSYYNGGVYQGTDQVYKMEGESFVLNSDAANKGRFAKREYFGFDAQYSLSTDWGITQIRGEYLWGTQPGTASSSKSPNASTLPTSDTYIRPFSGGYVMLVQDLGKLPLGAVVKYDWYDPNTKVSKDALGLNYTGAADVSYYTFGLGLLWYINNNLRIQAYYDFVNQEKSQNLAGFNTNLKDNSFTLRLQYKF